MTTVDGVGTPGDGMTIVEFLEARLAEDEYAATHAGQFPVPAAHYDRRTLREVASKRRILRRFQRASGTAVPVLLDDLRDIVAVYADHPDYDQAWGPRWTD